jgi:hypothetical protein
VRMLDLFCGRFGWGRVFAARGWDVVGFDLTMPSEIPARCSFVQQDILELTLDRGFLDFWEPDFICASSPCEQFSVHGMKHFHPNPPYPELGIKLFNHTRAMCVASGIPFVMENVRAAQQFVGKSVHHCGAFHLWGNAVPVLMPQGIIKGWEHKYIDRHGRKRGGGPGRYEWSTSKGRRDAIARVATIPPELAACVCEYAERITQLELAV